MPRNQKAKDKLHEIRMSRALEIARKYGEERGYEVTEVIEDEKFNYLYVIGTNHNLNKDGNEIGEFRKRFYQFLLSDEESVELNTEKWVKLAKLIHPEYDYSKVEFVDTYTHVTIGCPIHGDFKITPKNFIKPETLCPKCQSEVVERERGKEQIKILQERCPDYDFSEANYIDTKTPIKVRCPKHGEFYIKPSALWRSGKCPECSKESRRKKRSLTTEEFIRKAKEVHGDRYDYSLVDYVDGKTEVVIICPTHGRFKIKPSNHLAGNGCPKCGGNYKRTQDEVVNEFRKVHGDKYDYSKVQFEKMNKKVCIICHEKDEFGNEHGEFWMTPKHHLLRGYGCSKCSRNYMDKEMFVRIANKIHGNYYDYSRVEYVNNHTKVEIICPEHGSFWQQPNSHIVGKQGCPLCKTSHLERSVNQQFKNKLGLEYIYQYHNKDIFFKQSLDFYIPSKRIGVECQGEQHFIANFFKSKGIEHAEKHHEYVKELDERKRQLCKDNGIQLVYYLESKFEKFVRDLDIPYFTDIESLMEYIQSAPDVVEGDVTVKES